jgi:TolB-like protein/DNA-binding winged helix-turn-helix (wHTH) protein
MAAPMQHDQGRDSKSGARFGEFEWDSRRGLVTANGNPVKLQPQPLRVLEMLLQRAPEVVTREELGDHIWGRDVHVEMDASLNYCVRQIRLALNDNPTEPRYVETLPKQGYRLVAAVERFEEAAEAVSAVPPAVRLATGLRSARREIWPAASVVGYALLLAFFGWWTHRHSPVRPPTRSLAVLPLENLSGDVGQDYFAEGMTDELTTELASIPGLRVVSTTSAMREKGNRKTLQQIARELAVDTIVEGSVMRSRNKVRISVRVIDVRDDKPLWAQSFEGQSGDIVSLQDRVAGEIALRAKVALVPEVYRYTVSRPVNPAAYDAYLRGNYFYAKEDLRQSAAYFQQAIAIDSSYASAYAGLADDLEAETTFGLARVNDAIPRALAAARHAIALDPGNGKAYEALGSIETIYEWNWQAAERNLTQSIALSPSYSVVQMKYATYLDAMGRPEEAVSHMRRAVSLDPLSFYMTRRLGATLYLARDYDEALHQLRRAVEMEPGKHASFDGWMSVVYEEKGMRDEAVDHDLSSLQSNWPKVDISNLRSVYQRQGWNAYWRARVHALLPYRNRNCMANELGLNYIRLGDREAAFSSFNRAVDERCYQVVWLKTDPILDPIRGDERYNELLQRLNLADR